MPRAIIAALLIVTGVYVLVAIAAIGAQKWEMFDGQGRGLRRSSTTSPDPKAETRCSPRCGDLDLLGHPWSRCTASTRILFAMGRDGLLPAMFAKVNPQEHDDE